MKNYRYINKKRKDTNMSELSLPPVAKSFYTFCKKCEADRYHVVLAHKTATSASIQCEICKSKKTYSLPKPGAAKGKTTGGRAGGASVPRRSHTGDYEVRMQNMQNKDATPYSIKGKFAENQKLNHAKFGIGFVIKTYDDKVDVIFTDEVKTLMHNRL